jgi:hypothetical protein
VCPCEINLGCDVDDVVASDLLPRKRQEKEKIEMRTIGNGKFKSFLASSVDKLSTIKISGEEITFLLLLLDVLVEGPRWQINL